MQDLNMYISFHSLSLIHIYTYVLQMKCIEKFIWLFAFFKWNTSVGIFKILVLYNNDLKASKGLKLKYYILKYNHNFYAHSIWNMSCWDHLCVKKVNCIM